MSMINIDGWYLLLGAEFAFTSPLFTCFVFGAIFQKGARMGIGDAMACGVF